MWRRTKLFNALAMCGFEPGVDLTVEKNGWSA